MNNVVTNHASQTTTGAIAFAVGAAMAAGQPAWPVGETPNYVVAQTEPSYSMLSEQLTNSAQQLPHADFVRDMAGIYASLSERQERLGEEFEAAIFDDLDSLYES